MCFRICQWFVWHYFGKDMFKSSVKVCGPQKIGLVMGETENPSFLWFRDCWTCPWAPKPIMFNFGDTKLLQIIQGRSGSFSNILFLEVHKYWNSFVLGNVGKTHADTILKIHLTCSWNSGIWDQYLPENMNWKLGNVKYMEISNMGSISSIKNEWTFSIEGTSTNET